MNGVVAVKVSNDRWLNLLLWAVIILVAGKLFLMLTVPPDRLAPDKKPVPTNPRQLSPAALASP